SDSAHITGKTESKRLARRVSRTAAVMVAAACGMAAGCAAAVPEERLERPRPSGEVAGALGIDSTACEVTAKLIPSCGAWWGIAPEVFTGRKPRRALASAEQRMRRGAAVMHVYHRDGELFPTRQERAIAR